MIQRDLFGIFSAEVFRRQMHLMRTVDALNTYWGRNTLYLVPRLDAKTGLCNKHDARTAIQRVGKKSSQSPSTVTRRLGWELIYITLPIATY